MSIKPGELQGEAIADADDPIAALLNALEGWLENTPACGCLFLRALGEYGDEPIAPIVSDYKAELRRQLYDLTRRLGAAQETTDALMIIVEGATAAAPTLGSGPAIDAARTAAKALFK